MGRGSEERSRVIVGVLGEFGIDLGQGLGHSKCLVIFGQKCPGI